MGQFASNHNIGVLAFNPTAAAGSPDYGILYASFGDAGAANDPRDFSQTLSEPHGAIIRIDPLPGDDSRGYGIPADNPFVGEAGVAPKIWAYGLRHAQQFSWDADGRMFMGDIGPNFVEEVNLGIPGANYGWRLCEGTFATGYGRAGRRTTWTGRCAAPGLEPVRGHRPRGVLRPGSNADTVMRVADAPVKREDAPWTKPLSGYCCSTCVRSCASSRNWRMPRHVLETGAKERPSYHVMSKLIRGASGKPRYCGTPRNTPLRLLHQLAVEDATITFEIFATAAGVAFRGAARPDVRRLVNRVRRILDEENATSPGAEAGILRYNTPLRLLQISPWISPRPPGSARPDVRRLVNRVAAILDEENDSGR